jgi:hypothetical protein
VLGPTLKYARVILAHKNKKVYLADRGLVVPYVEKDMDTFAMEPTDVHLYVFMNAFGIIIVDMICFGSPPNLCRVFRVDLPNDLPSIRF